MKILTPKKMKGFWIALAVLALILLVSFSYVDILVTTRHGINFWDFLFQGRILYFFEDNICASGNSIYTGVYPCVYNILVYLVFAIWNFPLWLLEKASVDVMNSIPCLVWMKMLPISVTVLCAYLTGKTLRQGGVSKERISITRYIYLSSSLILTTVLISSRYDTFCSVFMILSLNAFLKEDRKQFILWSGIAICFNYFALLLYVPLLLLREKKVLRILKDLLLVLIPYVVTTIPFMAHPYPDKTGYTLGQFNMLFSRTGGQISWFVVAFASIMVYAYRKSWHTEDIRTAVWISCFSVASVFIFCFSYPYWPVLMSPFLAMLLGVALPENDNTNSLLETIAMLGLVLENMIFYYWCYIDGCMRPMIMSVLMPNQLNNSHVISDFWMSLRGKSTGLMLLHSLFAAGMLILAYVNFPGKEAKQDPKNQLLDSRETNTIWILRCIATWIICLLPFLTLIR